MKSTGDAVGPLERWGLSAWATWGRHRAATFTGRLPADCPRSRRGQAKAARTRARAAATPGKLLRRSTIVWRRLQPADVEKVRLRRELSIADAKKRRIGVCRSEQHLAGAGH
jgi:hypothetical protein